MGQNTPAIRVPYQRIHGLPPKAQIEIQRDFEELIRNITAVTTGVYDALIDTTLSSSIPAQHRYKNFGDFIANESIGSKNSWAVGVLPTGGTITETADVTWAANVTVELVTRPMLTDQSGYDSVVWDIHGHVLTLNNVGGLPTTLRIRGLSLENTGATVTNWLSGSQRMTLIDCLVYGPSTSGAYTHPCAGTLAAMNTTFEGMSFNAATLLVDCHMNMTQTSSFTLTSSNFWWLGGTYSNPNVSTAVVITIDGTSDNIVISGVVVDPNTFIAGATSSGVPTISVTNTGTTHVHCLSAGNPWNITVASAAGPVYVDGDWRLVTFSANTGPSTRRFNGTATQAVDISGPANVDVAFVGTASLIVRGSGVRANVGSISTTNTGTPAIQFLSASNALVTAAFSVNVSGKPYAIDASSSKCILIIAGSNAGWSTAGTNVGTTCLVIDETFTGGGGGSAYDDALAWMGVYY